MKPLGISRNQLARDIDVPVGRISDITNGKRGISADTALRLGRYFGTSPDLWMRLQSAYDLHVSRTTSWPGVAPRVRVLRQAEAGVEDGAGGLDIAAAPVDPPVDPSTVAGDAGSGQTVEDIPAAAPDTSDPHSDEVDLSIPPSP